MFFGYKVASKVEAKGTSDESKAHGAEVAALGSEISFITAAHKGHNCRRQYS